MSDKKKKNKKSYDKNKAAVQTAKSSNVLEEWFFMSTAEPTIEQMKECLESIPGAELEIWKEMGVIECHIPEKISMDMEQIDCDLEDEESNAFLQKNEIKTVYAVTIQAQQLEEVSAILKPVAAALDGFFCGDTEDFLPVISAK